MKSIITTVIVLLSFISHAQQKVKLTILVPNPSDEVFIVGNQPSLGDWQPNKIKLNHVSNYEREIELALSFPAEFKFTRGSWESEAIVADISANTNIVLTAETAKALYVIKHWSDEIKTGSYHVNYLVETLDSKILGGTRTYKVFLPENYSKDKLYPVFYVTDASWSNFEIALNYINQLAKNKAIPEVILVGVVHKNRGTELDVFWTETGVRFKDYLFEELIPHIDLNYATSGFNAIIGHSDGAEYNHLLMLQDNNPFKGFINLSTNFNTDISNEISQFFKNYTKGKFYYFLASATYDSEDRLQAGYKINDLFQNNKNDFISFKHQIYKGDHNNLVSKAMLDGISHIFKDYRNLEPYDNFRSYTETYSKTVKEAYGFNPELHENDIDLFFGKILDNKDIEAYNYLIQYTAEHNIFESNTLDRANHYFYMQHYAKTIVFWNKTIDEFKAIEPRVFYLNFNKALEAYNLEKDPKGALRFLEKSKERLPEYALVFNYFIAKISDANDMRKSSYKAALAYCKKNYEPNIYFTSDDLKVLK